jgi:LCP family protein required for cell wall assembly
VFERLTLTFLHGPQGVVDGLCQSLGITADHLVIVDFRSFAAIVDEVGGIEVDLPFPLRDPVTGLDLGRAGTVHLDGRQALALVRSRQPQQFVRGRWTAAADGSEQRTDWAGKVLSAVLQAARRRRPDPWALQQLAWTASESLTTDPGTGLFDLLHLSELHGPVEPLPARAVANSLAVVPDAATARALANAGYARRCVPPLAT